MRPPKIQPKRQPWLSRSEAAEHLGMKSPDRLAAYVTEDAERAKKGLPPQGPAFWKPLFAARNGMTRYHLESLDLWAMGDPKAPRGPQSVHVEQIMPRTPKRTEVTPVPGHAVETSDGNGFLDDVVMQNFRLTSAEDDGLVDDPVTGLRVKPRLRADWTRAAAEADACLAKLRP
jgi:hypothetical protein